MTSLLVIAHDDADLEAAIAGGADIVELRHVAGDALAALKAARLRGLAAGSKGRAVKLRITCMTGEASPEQVAAGVEGVLAAGADEVAVGLPAGDLVAFAHALKVLAQRCSLVGMLFADRMPQGDPLSIMADAGFSGVAVGIFDPGAGRLLDRLRPAEMGVFIETAHARGLTVDLAGGLEAPDVPRLVALGADSLGFRALLLDEATGHVDASRVAEIAALIAASAGSAAVPVRTLHVADRIFVRDFVVDMQIGAYRSEHGRLQKVRFDVLVDVRPVADSPQGMRDVFSYDLILDGIRAIAARGHVDFVETVAEEVARLVLAHPSAETVQVRVEKLELGAGGVGVEIRRSRA